MPRLSDRTLGSLHPGVAVPTYHRGSLTAGVVHVGVGGFHRAHEAMYLDRLLNQGGDPGGVDDEGRPYSVEDRRWQQLAPLAARQRTQPDALLSLGEVFGDLAAHPRFVTAYLAALLALHERGARAVVRALTPAE